MPTLVENQLTKHRLQQAFEDLVEVGQMAIRRPQLAIPLILVACGLNTPVVATKTPETSSPTQGVTETVADTETPEESETPQPEGQLFPISWDQRFIIEMPNGFDYDQLSQILQTNNSLALNDDTHAAVSCSSMPDAESNQDLLLPTRTPFSFDKVGIIAIYEVKSENDLSDFILSLKCSSGQATSVVNLFFGHDIPKDTQNFINELLTNDYYGGWALVWGKTPFTGVPNRAYSENLVNVSIDSGTHREFYYFSQGLLDPEKYEEDRNLLINLSSGIVVVYDFDLKP